MFNFLDQMITEVHMRLRVEYKIVNGLNVISHELYDTHFSLVVCE